MDDYKLSYQKEYLEESLLAFTKYLFKKVNTRPFLVNWHHIKMIDALEKVYTGEITRLVINVPPRYGKSEIVRNFCAWSLAKAPYSNFIYTSFSQDLVLECSDEIKKIIKSDAYQTMWELEIRKDKDSMTRWKTQDMGGLYAVSMGGAITGFGAGVLGVDGFGGALIIDDPLKPEDSNSDVLREKGLRYYQRTLKNRLNGPTPIIVIMQRLHETDLTGFLEESKEDWDIINIPVVNDDFTIPLWERMHTIEELKEMRDSDPYGFSGQYLGTPTPSEGGNFKKEWFQYYDRLPELDRIIQSWDTAFKKGRDNDYSVCTTWGVKKTTAGDNYYLINVYRGKLEYPGLKKKFKELQERFDPSLILIEDKASGQSLLQDLQDAGNKRLKPIKVSQDKEDRATAPSSMFESGCVWLPREANWLSDFIHELLLFPNSAHDDQVDSTTQALNFFNKPKRELTFTRI